MSRLLENKKKEKIHSILTPPPPASRRIDPAQEIARLRHSISLLEAYVFPTQRSYSAVRRGSEVAPVIPKKEIIDPDISEKLHPPTAPGMLGNQMQGGTYAGPTSVATHLPVWFKMSSSYRHVF